MYIFSRYWIFIYIIKLSTAYTAQIPTFPLPLADSKQNIVLQREVATPRLLAIGTVAGERFHSQMRMMGEGEFSMHKLRDWGADDLLSLC